MDSGQLILRGARVSRSGPLVMHWSTASPWWHRSWPWCHSSASRRTSSSAWNHAVAASCAIADSWSPGSRGPGDQLRLRPAVRECPGGEPGAGQTAAGRDPSCAGAQRRSSSSWMSRPPRLSRPRDRTAPRDRPLAGGRAGGRRSYWCRTSCARCWTSPTPSPSCATSRPGLAPPARRRRDGGQPDLRGCSAARSAARSRRRSWPSRGCRNRGSSVRGHDRAGRPRGEPPGSERGRSSASPVSSARGARELARAIYGAVPVGRPGRSTVTGAAVSGGPAASIRRGVAMIPESRKDEGLIGRRERCARTSASRACPACKRLGFVKQGNRGRPSSGEALDIVGARAEHVSLRVVTLSGGNQQKVLFARAVMEKPRLADRRRADPGRGCGCEGRSIYEVDLRACRGRRRRCC